MTSLEEIKRMLADASPGPWHEDDRGDDIEIVGKGNNCERFNVPDEWTVANVTVDIFDEETVPSRANAKLIAKAPTLIAELVDQVERLQKLEVVVRHMVDAIGKGAVDSEEIVPVPGDGPPYRFHEEWAHHARSALSPKEESDGE